VFTSCKVTDLSRSSRVKSKMAPHLKINFMVSRWTVVLCFYHNSHNTVVLTSLSAVLACLHCNIVFGYKPPQQCSRIHQMGFVRTVSWSSQNVESHWSHVHITLIGEHINFHAFCKKYVLQPVTDLRIGRGLRPRAFGGPAQLVPMKTHCYL